MLYVKIFMENSELPSLLSVNFHGKYEVASRLTADRLGDVLSDRQE